MKAMSEATNQPGDGGNGVHGASGLPSVAMTARFLGLCDAFGAEKLAVRIVRIGRTSGVAGLPATDNWPEWDAKEMRAAVEYLETKRGRR